MKRLVALLLSAALLLGLAAGCRQEPATGTVPPAGVEGPAALDVVNAVFPRCGYGDGSGDVEYLTGDEDGKEFLAAYLDNAYKLKDPWQDAAVIRGMGASAFELTVLRMEDEGAAVRAATALMTYTFERQGDFAGYAPDQADMAANGSVNQRGPYAALFICPDTALADAAFEAAVKGDSLPSPTPTFWVETLPPTDDLDELMEALLESCELDGDDVSDLERLDSGDPGALESYITDVYGLDRAQWVEAAIARGKGESVFELAALRAVEEQYAGQICNTLIGYLDAKEMMCAQIPAQADLLKRACAAHILGTNVLILAVCGNPENVFTTGLYRLGANGWATTQRHPQSSQPTTEPDPNYPDRIKFTPPNEDDMSLYDTSAIRAAWEKDDPDRLSGEDRKIYDKAKSVLRKALKDGMSDLEKETAIYSWIVNNVNYDWTHQDQMAETPRESFTPYGGLVNRKAVCLGYATTFQLLCDLAGIECITVVGAAHGSTSDHGWNMVRLDGDWYCVDVTWDANYREQGSGWKASGPEDWRYFNITSDEMAESDHQWDYANIPEAVTVGNGRG